MKNLFLILVTICFIQNLTAQTTVFYQGFENRGLNCTENWGYLGGNRTTENVKGGSYSLRVGRAGESNSVQFNTVDVTGMSNLILKVNHSVVSASGAGLDDFEGAIILVSLNGGLFMPVGSISGSADYGYTYSATTAGVTGTNQICNLYTASNPLNYTIPTGTNTVAIRIMSVAGINCKSFNNNMNTGIAGNYNGANEGFYVDEISIVSNDPNIRSIWRGTANTNWFDCRNWHNNLIPTAQSTVVIDETAVNRCVIGTSAGNTAYCKELTVSSSNTVNNSLTIQNNSSLTVSQTVFVSKTGSASAVSLELLSGSTLNCSSLTLTGTSNGAENAVLRVEDFMSRVNVSGDFRLNAGGSLDMSNGSASTGVFAIAGNWFSNGLVTDFNEEGSTVIFNGANAQTINTNGFTEIFHNLSLEKTNAELTLMSNIELDETGVLNLNDDYLVLNSKMLSLQNSTSAAIRQNGGAIVSETTDNMSRLSWNIGTDADVHEFPFANSVNGEYLPMFYTVNSGNAGVVTLSTYGTATDNLPLPNGPLSTVTNLGNPNNSDATADRFWNINVTGTPEATLTFTYAANELPVAPYDDAYSMIAQRYESSNNQWEQALPNQISAPNTVTVSGVRTFGTWALANQYSALPVEMILFKAEKVAQTVELKWATASENNTEVFVVERSVNGVEFETIGEVAAVGFSTLRNDYDFVDSKPNSGINYYRLKVVDFDNSATYTNVIAINFEKAASVNVYPNPLHAERIVNIDAPFTVEKLSIVNTLGQIMMKFDNPQNSVQLPSEWAAGTYYMVFETAGNNVVNQIVIQ